MYERNSRSGLFLMEMIISILFFSITSAITVQLFIKAHNIDDQSVSLSQGSIILQNVAEVFRSCDGDFEQTSLQFDDLISEHTENSFHIYYNETWNPSSQPSQKGYTLEAVFSETDQLRALNLSIYSNQDNQIILELNVLKNKPLENLL